MNIFSKTETDRICFTHYSPKRMQSLYEVKQRMESEGKTVILATDDLELDLSYTP